MMISKDHLSRAFISFLAVLLPFACSRQAMAAPDGPTLFARATCVYVRETGSESPLKATHAMVVGILNPEMLDYWGKANRGGRFERYTQAGADMEVFMKWARDTPKDKFAETLVEAVRKRCF